MNVWTKLGGGSNIILDEGHVVGIASTLVSLTDNSTNNSQPAWQPVSFGAQTPRNSVAGAIIPPTSLRLTGWSRRAGAARALSRSCGEGEVLQRRVAGTLGRNAEETSKSAVRRTLS